MHVKKCTGFSHAVEFSRNKRTPSHPLPQAIRGNFTNLPGGGPLVNSVCQDLANSWFSPPTGVNTRAALARSDGLLTVEPSGSFGSLGRFPRPGVPSGKMNSRERGAPRQIKTPYGV